MAYSRRLFDANWLKSNFANFELVGIVNRLDRVSFDNSNCGETRFIYRLSYKSKVNNYSRLPFTLMVKYKNVGDAETNWAQCKEYAKSWIYPGNVTTNLQLSDWLMSEGPLKLSLR